MLTKFRNTRKDKYKFGGCQDSNDAVFFTPKKTKFKGYMRDKSCIKRHKN